MDLITQKDKRFIKDDPNFNPAKNKAIIAQTIKETEQFFAKLEELRDQDIANRVDIVGSYGRYRFNTGTKDFKNYVGPQLYNSLIGENLLSKVRVMDSVNRLHHNTGKFKKSILL